MSLLFYETVMVPDEAETKRCRQYAYMLTTFHANNSYQKHGHIIHKKLITVQLLWIFMLSTFCLERCLLHGYHNTSEFLWHTFCAYS